MIRKKFDIVKKIHFYGSHDFTYVIRGWLEKGIITLNKAEWSAPFRQRNKEAYPIDLSKQNIWSTYNRCVDSVIEKTDDGIQITVTVWDGDNLDGFRTKKRFTAIFETSSNEILENEWVVSSINSYFKTHILTVYEDREDERVEKELEKIEKELLS